MSAKEFNMMTTDKHTFTVCAYKESAFLEECVKSLTRQTLKSKIIICTSTPNEHIKSVAEKYGLELFINEGEKGITGDWNFACSKCDTEFFTIAHQDDVYEPEYLENILKKFEASKKPIIAFSEYFEVRNGNKVYKNKLLKIKKMLNFGFRLSKRSRFIRRRVLSLGCSICCPAVTFSKEGCSDFKFCNEFKFTCDWDAWERLSKRKGDFVYINKPLMGHRIHEESTTTAMSESGERAKEEFTMLRRFWPAWIAKIICKPYKKAAASNANI